MSRSTQPLGIAPVALDDHGGRGMTMISRRRARHGLQEERVVLRKPLLPVVVVLVVAASGCTFKSVKPELSLAPTQTYSTAVLGDVTVEDKLVEGLLPHFRRGFVQRLGEKKAFESVLDGAPAEHRPAAMTLSGTITEVNKGSAAARMLIGFGAGRARVNGTFEIKDAAGTTLAKFSRRQSYAGGLGIGGIGLLDMEDLMRRFGETVAEDVLRWSKGEKIE